jgi:hypothetical protein
MENDSNDDTAIELKQREPAVPESTLAEFLKRYEETAIAGVSSELLSLFLYSSWWVTDRKLPFCSLSQLYDYLLGGALRNYYSATSQVPLLGTTVQEQHRQLEAYYAKDLHALSQYAFDRFHADPVFRATWNANNDQYLSRFALLPDAVEHKPPQTHFGLLEREGAKSGHFKHYSLQAYFAARYVLHGLAGKDREGAVVIERKQQDEALDYIKERTYETPHAMLNWFLSGFLLDEERSERSAIIPSTLTMARASLQAPSQSLSLEKALSAEKQLDKIDHDNVGCLVSVIGELEAATFQAFGTRFEAEAQRLHVALHALGHVGQALGLSPRVAVGLLEARRSQALKSKLTHAQDSIRYVSLTVFE